MIQGISYMKVLLCPMCMAPVENDSEKCPYCDTTFGTADKKPEATQFSQRDPLALKLKDLLTEYFDLAEIKDMVWVLGLDKDDILPSGKTKTEGCIALIDKMAQRGRIAQLYAKIKEERPHLGLS